MNRVFHLLFVLAVALGFTWFDPPKYECLPLEKDEVACPNGYALEVSPGRYVKCENFDLYYNETDESDVFEFQSNPGVN